MPGKARSILIVEDEPLIAMMLEDFLETLGHKVVASCDSVAMALDHVAAGGFEVAILDVSLKDGHQVWPVPFLIEPAQAFILCIFYNAVNSYGQTISIF